MGQRTLRHSPLRSRLRWTPNGKEEAAPAHRVILRRLAALPLLLFGLSLLVFVIGRQIPGDPALVFAGGDLADPDRVEEIRREWGLDKSLPEQYVRYVGRLLQGDLGYSVTQRTDVSEVLRDRLPATLELGFVALVIGVPAGLGLGIASATRQGRLADHGARFVAISGLSLPIFWVALMLVYVFSVELGWLPIGGRTPAFTDFEGRTGFYLVDSLIQGDLDMFVEVVRHLALPALSLALIVAAFVARFARSSFIDVLSENYIRTAHAYGMHPSTVVWQLAAKNAFLPLVTVIGLLIPALATGSVLVESVFSWPGIGLFLFDGLRGNDYAVVQSVTLLVAVLYVVTNLLVDLSYFVLDPRMRRQ